MTRRRIALLAGLLALIAAPWFTTGTQSEFIGDILIYSLFALSLNILIGQLGLLSFGHGTFFGLGGYAAAFMLLKASHNLWLMLAVVIAVCALSSLVIGYFALLARGMAFIMITMAISQLFYIVAVTAYTLTGGVDGLTSVPRPEFFPGADEIRWLSLSGNTAFYYLCLAFFLLGLGVIYRLRRSPLGAAFEGIRENEERMRSVGYPVGRYKLIGFVMSGTLAGIAGALSVIQLGFAGPTAFFWTTSGEVILAVIIGGASTLFGPVIGSALFLSLFRFIGQYTEHWRLFVGIVFVALVMFAPGGLSELWRRRKERAAQG